MKTHFKQAFVSLSFITSGLLTALSAANTDYYWIVETDPAGNPLASTARFWTLDNSTATPVVCTSAPAFNAATDVADSRQNVYLGEYARSGTGNFGMMNMPDGALYFGDFVNNKTTIWGTVTPKSWDIYTTSSTGVWNIRGNLVQDSSQVTMQMRNSSGTVGKLKVNVTGATDMADSGKLIVQNGTMAFGTIAVGAFQYYIDSVNVSGLTSVTGKTVERTLGGTLFLAANEANFNGGLTVSGEAANVASNLRNTFTVTGDTTVSGTGAKIALNVAQTAAGVYSTTTAANFKGKVTVSDGGALILGATTTNYVLNAKGKLSSFSATDLDYTASAPLQANVGSFKVKASETVLGSTGTFNWSSGNVTNNRLYMQADSMDIDILNVGKSTDTNASYFEVFRGSDVTDPHIGVGDVKIGTLNVDGALSVRLGYLNNSLRSYVKYANITIDALTLNSSNGNPSEFYADAITINSFSKKGASSLVLGMGNSNSTGKGMAATTITIGKDAAAVSTLEKGDVAIAGLTNTINGDFRMGVSGVKSAAALEVRSACDTNGDWVASTTNINKLTFLKGLNDSDGSSSFTIKRSGAYANNITITEVVLDAFISASIGETSSRLGDVNITTITNSSTTSGNMSLKIFSRNTDAETDSASATYYSTNITNYNHTGSAINRVSLNQNTKIDTFNMKSSASGAVESEASMIVNAYVKTLNYENNGTYRFGDTAANKYFTSLKIDTLNMSAGVTGGGLLSVYSRDTNIGIIDITKRGKVDFYGTATIGAIKVNDSLGATGSAYSSLSFRENSTITGNIELNIQDASNETFLNLGVANGKTLTSTGVISLGSKGALQLNYAIGTPDTSSVSNYVFAGVSSQVSDGSLTRIYTDAASGNVTLTLNGSADFDYKARIHDFSGTLESDLPIGAKISITKSGSGVQKLMGDNYYRGLTTVNSGELHIRTNTLSNKKGLGIGDVMLNGGKFSAIEANSEIGSLTAKDLTWNSGASIIVDISGTGHDIINLDTLTKGTGTAFTFELNIENIVKDYEYQLLGFADSTFSDADDFEYIVQSGSLGDLVGKFKFLENSGVYLTFTAIPEPSTYAAIFAFAALLFAIRRRRK